MKLTQNQIRILTTLFLYRGSVQMYITRFFYKKFDTTISNEKYIYGQLSKLDKKGYVTNKIIRYKDKYLSLYFLTPSGLERVKGLLNIEIGAHGNGLLPHCNETAYWDIPYEFYKPPFKQIDHFLLTQEVYLQIEIQQELRGVHYKTAHYSSVSFVHQNEKIRLRPDSYMKIDDTKFALEVDRSKESEKQLIEKFERYKRYIDFCNKQHSKVPYDYVLFLMSSDLPARAYKMRWQTIQSAYRKVFGNECEELNLLLYPISEIKSLPDWLSVEEYYKNRDSARRCKENVTVEIFN